MALKYINETIQLINIDHIDESQSPVADGIGRAGPQLPVQKLEAKLT